MKDDVLAHFESSTFEAIADTEAKKPGSVLKLTGGYNELTIESTGNAQDGRKLKVNDVEVVTKDSLKAYANGVLNPTGKGFTAIASPTMRFIGSGTSESPAEAQVNLPAATETEIGIVKVVQEGSHGFPCPGISDRLMAGVYDQSSKTWLLLRNGADDLEKDVFIAYLNTDTGVYTPTADRFRPPALPVTAKPLNVCMSGQGTVLINTTDGLFALLTNNNTDWHSWRAIKLNFAPHELIPAPGSGGEYWRGRYTFVIGTKLYYVTSILNNAQMYVALWDADITAANVVSMTFRPLTGTNFNNTAQSGTTAFHLFDKIWGSSGEKCFGVSNGHWNRGVDTAHHGDDIDFVIEGNKLRVCHDGFNYAARDGADMSTRHNLSYVIDLGNKTVSPDRDFTYPMSFGTSGWSHPAHNPLMGHSGGNEEFTPLRSNGAIASISSDNLSFAPYMAIVTNNSGDSDFENIRNGKNRYQVRLVHNTVGLYGGAVRMGWGAIHAVDDNTYIGKNADGATSIVKVDPYGSYGPTIPGYGPTNDRKDLNYTDYFTRKRMVSFFDGDRVRLQGAVLNDEYMSSFTQVNMNGELEAEVSIDGALFNQFKQQVINAVASGCTGIQDTKLNLMVHRCDLAPCIGLLQVIHQEPNNAAVNCYTDFMFVFKPNRVVGNIDTLRYVSLLNSRKTVSNSRYFSGASVLADVCTHSLMRLDDGNYVITIAGIYEGYIGNAHVPQGYVLWDRKLDKVNLAGIRVNHSYLRNGLSYAKDFGFGYFYQSDAGESYYMDCYGKTMADVNACITGSRTPTRYTIVMSRTDAGDNVTISQAAATRIKDKIVSLIPPSRLVQGMDLTQDRTITKSQIAGTNNISNTHDRDYPIQQKHRDSLTGKTLSNHTHNSSDFTMAPATTTRYGSARLGGVSDGDGLAFDARAMASLPVNDLTSRPTKVTNLDVTMPVDVEI